MHADFDMIVLLLQVPLSINLFQKFHLQGGFAHQEPGTSFKAIFFADFFNKNFLS